MKRKKIKLEELKIQSFITELQPDAAQTAKGGDDRSQLLTTCGPYPHFTDGDYFTSAPKSCTPTNCNTLPDLGPSPTIAGPAPTIGIEIN